MRACNGCRKRKIKCDAATTNTWPCSACTRLKLVCVPPTIGQDGEFPEGQLDPASTDTGESSAPPEASHHSFPVPPIYRNNSQAGIGTMPSYDSMGMYSQFVQAPQSQPSIYSSPPMAMPQQPYRQQQPYPAQPQMYVEPEQSTAENLSEVLGELKIDESGIGRVPLAYSKSL